MYKGQVAIVSEQMLLSGSILFLSQVVSYPFEKFNVACFQLSRLKSCLLSTRVNENILSSPLNSRRREKINYQLSLFLSPIGNLNINFSILLTFTF